VSQAAAFCIGLGEAAYLTTCSLTPRPQTRGHRAHPVIAGACRPSILIVGIGAPTREAAKEGSSSLSSGSRSSPFMQACLRLPPERRSSSCCSCC